MRAGRAATLGLFAVWALVSLLRLGRVVEPPQPPPGQEVVPSLPFLRTTLPADAGYLYVLPGEFGTDSGVGPRLRYELYPRFYDDIRASVTATDVRDLMRAEGLEYVVVTDATQYPADHWVRQVPPWLRRIDLDATRYVLQVTS